MVHQQMTSKSCLSFNAFNYNVHIYTHAVHWGNLNVHHSFKTNELAHEIMVLITKATSKGSGEGFCKHKVRK